MQVGDNMVARDHAFLDRNKQIASFRISCFVGIDDNARMLNRVRVDFAGVGLEGSDQVEMCSGTEIVCVEKRCRAGGAGAEDVRLSSAGASVCRCGGGGLMCDKARWTGSG